MYLSFDEGSILSLRLDYAIPLRFWNYHPKQGRLKQVSQNLNNLTMSKISTPFLQARVCKWERALRLHTVEEAAESGAVCINEHVRNLN